MIALKLLLPLLLCLQGLVAPAKAESTLDKYLKKNTETKSSAGGGASKKVHENSDGYWKLDDTRASGGFCAITYVSTGKSSAGYVGPSASSPDAYIVFVGASIAPIKDVVRKKMTLTTGSDGQASSVQAFHGPNPQKPESGIISFRMTSIREAVDLMADVEEVGVVLDEKKVFSLQWKGGHTARKAMQACLGGSAN